MLKKIMYCVFVGLCGLYLIGCSNNMGIKRRGYYKIHFPKNTGNKVFDIPGYPYKFEYPSYAVIEKDTSFFDAKPENDYWLNIGIPELNAKLYISYKLIAKQGKNSFDSLLYQTTAMSFKHSAKATGIDPQPFTTPKGIQGVFFDLSGDVATSKQFFVTDSSKHFFRGALYFEASPNNDSLSPIYQFLEKDLKLIANSLEWKN